MAATALSAGARFDGTVQAGTALQLSDGRLVRASDGALPGLSSAAAAAGVWSGGEYLPPQRAARQRPPLRWVAR